MSDSQYAVIYDLHSHTTASDGRLTPQELVHRAHEMRVGTLAITDHDSVAAIPAAREEIARAGLPLTLVNGVEISTLWENHEIHIVGLNIDIAHPTMTALLEEQKARRQQRGQMIAERLEKARIPRRLGRGAADWRTVAPSPAAILPVFWWRPAMRKNMAEVFKKYLARGKTGYVPPQWCTIKQAIDVIHHSGGKAVIAHPGRYDLSAKWLKRLLAHFSEQGGDAMEVAQCQQAPHERAQLATLAVQFGLLASQGSDFHQPCAWIELGRKLWLPAGVEGVWHSWEAAAE
ncbi:metal-dependent phosphoesterases (PHP family) [Klebsiella pneumoniae]|uniref:Metal-dependent phosphoesterases (PHP family) n=1 Tax=Klebsiella pneumoniae TaxID=573 RepID=A0A4P0Y5R6_KLEPN|nr:metal-dependent phosphoesterases (PHP family) [Klebsiella pneumoniae]